MPLVKKENDERLNNAIRVFSIYPWLSAKHSYIQLDNNLNSDKIKCDDEMNIKVKISSVVDLSDKNVYFNLQSRSGIVNSGYYNFPSGQAISNYTIGNRNEYSIELISANKKLLDFKSKIKSK